MESVGLLMAALKREGRRNFVVSVMDHVFEMVVRGLEENDFKEAQRRIALLKFIGECFNFQVIHTDTLLCLLYRLINWDFYTQEPDTHMGQLDSSGDCFRVRMVCTLLDSIGKIYFSKGKRKLLMDRFLMFFQCYIMSKNYILMDLEFMLLDTLDTLRPKSSAFV